jgi:hypothetical protein
MKYLQRVDSGRTHCWVVRIGTPKKENYVQESFTDHKYGSKKDGFTAAVKFIEDQLVKKNLPFNEKDYQYKEEENVNI